MKIIVPPNILLNPVYLNGLDQPLLDVAEILDEQNRPHHALAIREAIQIIQIYTQVLVTKEARLETGENKIKKIRLVSSASGSNSYGYVDKEYVEEMVKNNAVLEARLKNMNYYEIINSGKLVHVYNAFEID